MKKFTRKLKQVSILLVPIIVWIGIALFGGLEGWWLSSVADKDDMEGFSQYATQYVENNNHGSTALVLIKKGNIHTQHFVSTRNTINSHTLFAAASMSKLLTAIGVIQLANQGHISLDNPVNQYLKRWKIPSSEFNADQVTVAQLLSHTSGLTDGLGFGDYQAAETVPSIIETLNAPRASAGKKQIRLGLPAGEKWKYSGGGYLILELLIEDVTGEPFEQWMKTHIFTPLSMNRSNYKFMALLDNQAGSFDTKGNEAEIFQYASPGATGLLTTAHDLTQLAKALGAPDISQAHSTAVNLKTAQRLRESVAALYGEYIWGKGAMLYAPVANNDYIFGHDGSNDPAINTAFRINPNTGDAIIALTTGHRTLASNIAFEWTLWQSGKPDFIMFNRAIKSSFIPLIIGVLIWLVVLIAFRRIHSH